MNWSDKFHNLAKHIATWSKDKNSKIGCVIADDKHRVLSVGYNGFPQGANDNVQTRYDRPQK